MRWSFKVGRVFGIELRIHVTFFLILLFAAYIWGVGYHEGVPGAFYGVLVISVLFVFVVVHELSHSRLAQHYGAEVASITLLPIGGVSLLKKMPEEPSQELLVSLVGPLSNVVIGILFVILYAFLPGKAPTTTSQAFVNVLTGISVQGFVLYMAFINILLALFNLIPAFPLDGGRVLRSFLAGHMSYTRATRIAVRVGQTFAFVLGIGGLLIGQWLWILIAIFIYMGAEQEGSGTEMKSILSRLNVGQAVTGDTQTISPEDRLGSVVGLVLHHNQEDFPVVSGGQLVGMLTRNNLIRGLHSLGPDGVVSEIMLKDYPVVSAGAPFSEVYERMNESRTKAVPVLEDGHLLGMVTLEHLSDVFMLLTATDKPLDQILAHQ
ncbi:MAG: site-2 protease family protein [Actinobacteria bacterium]|nr:site-2 protease family protein [Actinomycetota bacterium]